MHCTPPACPHPVMLNSEINLYYAASKQRRLLVLNDSTSLGSLMSSNVPNISVTTSNVVWVMDSRGITRGEVILSVLPYAPPGGRQGAKKIRNQKSEPKQWLANVGAPN